MKKILALTLAVGTLTVSGIAIARYTDKNHLGSMTPTNKETTAPNPQSGKHITASADKKAQPGLTTAPSSTGVKAATSASGTVAQFASIGSGVIGTPDGRVSDNPRITSLRLYSRKFQPIHAHGLSTISRVSALVLASARASMIAWLLAVISPSFLKAGRPSEKKSIPCGSRKVGIPSCSPSHRMPPTAIQSKTYA